MKPHRYDEGQRHRFLVNEASLELNCFAAGYRDRQNEPRIKVNSPDNNEAVTHFFLLSDFSKVHMVLASDDPATRSRGSIRETLLGLVSVLYDGIERTWTR